MTLRQRVCANPCRRPEYLACLAAARRQVAEHRLAVRARREAAAEAEAAARREAAAAGDERLVRHRRQRRAWAAAVALALPFARLRAGVLAAREASQASDFTLHNRRVSWNQNRSCGVVVPAWFEHA